MNLKDKQAQMTILSLQIATLTDKFEKLKEAVINEMNTNRIKGLKKIQTKPKPSK